MSTLKNNWNIKKIELIKKLFDIDIKFGLAHN